MKFRGEGVKANYFFFCILERVDGVNGQISMNPNDQCRSKLIQTVRLTVSRHGTNNWSALVKASKNKDNPATDEVSVENQSVILTESQ